MGLQGPVVTLVLQNPATLVNAQPQHQGAPFQAIYRAATLNAGQQPKIAWELPPPPALAIYQIQNTGIRAWGQTLMLCRERTLQYRIMYLL